jgi:hypothetical protein
MAGNPEITNNQTVGVDEGGIVKQIGRHLVTLQDGRLFTVDLGAGEGGPLRLSDRIDVYRDRRSAADWYDEMLVHGSRILVTAYSYGEGASEISVFRMDEAGGLTREGRFLLDSADYYSTENYATRLVGDSLVFYAPQPLPASAKDPAAWPRLRRANGDREADAGTPLIGPTDIYAPVGDTAEAVLHTVSVCPLAERLNCRTTAFVGPWMREFFVSPTDAFLWVGAPTGLPWSIDYGNRLRQSCGPNEHQAGSDEAALLYRIPLDGGAIGAVAVEGSPADQFAFESSGGRIRALLSRHGPGCVSLETPPSLALLDLPLTAFGGRVRHVSRRAYAALPPAPGDVLENRFVGPWLLYGGRSSADGLPGVAAQPVESRLFAVPLAKPADVRGIRLPHGIIRIERAGRDAAVTGYRDAKGLSLSYVNLAGAPLVAATTQLAGRVESENRSHAFGAWMRSDGSGLIGLPTSRSAGRAERGWSDSAQSELSFVAVAPDKALSSAGELAVRARRAAPGYACEVSCVDWYGNSRPIFTGGRIFALMGTELVEGRLAGGQIEAVGRVDLTGRPAFASRLTGPAASRR